MKRSSFILLLLIIYNQSSAMKQQTNLHDFIKIQIPADVIYDKLCKMHLNNFVKTTKIHEQLGAKSFYSAGFIQIIDSAIYFYLNNLRKQNSNEQLIQQCYIHIQNMRDPIIKELLKDYPQEIKKLKHDGFIEQPSSTKTPDISRQPKQPLWSDVVRNNSKK